jgi:hypothetical protein
MNRTCRRGIDSRFGTLGDGPRTEEGARKVAKAWANGWVGELLEVYGDYERKAGGLDAVCAILAFGPALAMLMAVVRQIPCLTEVVEVVDEETRVSLDGADLVGQARFVCHFHQQSFHERMLYLFVLRLLAKPAVELCLFLTRESSFPVRPPGL